MTNAIYTNEAVEKPRFTKINPDFNRANIFSPYYLHL